MNEIEFLEFKTANKCQACNIYILVDTNQASTIKIVRESKLRGKLLQWWAFPCMVCKECLLFLLPGLINVQEHASATHRHRMIFSSFLLVLPIQIHLLIVAAYIFSVAIFSILL